MNYSLDFINTFGRIDITEPEGTDAITWKLLKAPLRYAKDKTIAGDEVPLTFWNNVSGEMGAQAGIDFEGHQIVYITMGFKELVATRNSFNIGQGFEATTIFRSTENNIDFIDGEIDYAESDTDGLTFFTCNIVQETKRAEVERNSDVIINTLGNKDLKGNPVTPVSTVRFLQKAFPINVFSNYKTPTPLGLSYQLALGGAEYLYYNPSVGLDKYQIEDSFTPFKSSLGDNVYNEAKIANFRYVFARTKLTNLTIDIKNLNAATTLFSLADTTAFAVTYLIIRWGNSFLDVDSQSQILSTQTLSFIDQTNLDTSNYTFTIPVVEQGQSVYIYYLTILTGDPGVSFVANIPTMDIEINGGSVRIDTVIDAVHLEDFLAKGIEMSANLPLDAPDITGNGKFANQFVFTGKAFKYQMDKLNFVWKDEREDLREVNLDYFCLENKVAIAKHPDFYPNRDLGFIGNGIAPDSFSYKYSEGSKTKLINFKYKTYEKSELATGTNQSFNTEAQFLLQKRSTQNDYNITVNKVRDILSIEKQARDVIKQTTALESDDRINLVYGIPITAGTKKDYTLNLLHIIDGNGRINILNKINSDDSLGNFDWTTLGFTVGSTFYITIFGVRSQHTVYAVSAGLLTLTQDPLHISFFSGNTSTKIEYFLSGVTWQLMTDEGFNIIDNLNVQKSGGNLLATIKRNLENYYQLFALFNFFHRDKDIQCTNFVNNGKLRTQYQGGAILVEDAPIPYTSLPDPLITPNVFKTRVQIGFAQAVALIDAFETRYPDGTFGGWNRFYDKEGIIHKSFISSVAWNKVSETWECELEEKFDVFGLQINRVGNTIFINGASYVSTTLANGAGYYTISSAGYVLIYDNNNIEVNKPLHFTEISVEGVYYTDAQEDLFVIAMNALAF